MEGVMLPEERLRFVVYLAACSHQREGEHIVLRTWFGVQERTLDRKSPVESEAWRR